MNKREAANYARVMDTLREWDFTNDEAETLSRIERTLTRWAERECGDERGGAIERDEVTGKPFWTYETPSGKRGRYAIPDRERGALKRLEKLMKPHGMYAAYHQPDCRGCALYVIPIKELEGERIDSVYTRGLAICI